MAFVRLYASCMLLVLLQKARCEDIFGGLVAPMSGIPEHDLLHAIAVPFSNTKTQYFDEGLDGFPAFGLKPGSEIKSTYRLFMPEKLYTEFSITTTVKPATNEGGFLFSVVNPLDTVVQLGVQLIPSGPGLTNISLLYTDGNLFAMSQTIASFVVPSFTKKWSRFALKVSMDNVTLYFNCHEFDTVIVKRNPVELVFDSASTLYVGQAGQAAKGAFHEFKTLLDQSTQGVVYFSLGTNVKSKDLPLQIQKNIVSALAELPYTVFWKFENETLQGKPANVHISKWFPQNDLLGHRNIKAFVTQGGQQSMEEAVLNKVPLVGISFFADQRMNVKKIVDFGIGEGLEIDKLTKEVLKDAIVKVAEGESYHTNVARLSQLLTDSPMTGMERAVWWTEYVLRHGGAQHLRAPAADVYWYEYFMLDVLGTLLMLISIVILVLYISFRKLKLVLVSPAPEKLENYLRPIIIPSMRGD